MSPPGTRVVFVAGLSGSGRSTAMDAIEDLSFYSVDNLPPQLIEQFLDLCAKSTPPLHKIALAIDTREAAFVRAIPPMIEKLRGSGAQVDLIFLECSNGVLIDRYRETRRVHPLSPQGSVAEGIEEERKLLGELLQMADFVVDTGVLNIHQLRDTISRYVSGGVRHSVVNITSFGFKYGLPHHAELVFDVRFLPNPHFDPSLRPRTGRDPEVAHYVLEGENARGLMDHLERLLLFLVPLYDAEGKAYLSVSIGCTGGRHRSVAIAEALAAELRRAGREVNLTHRDIERDE